MAAEWLRADQVAVQTAGHTELLTLFTDMTGRREFLGEGCCAKCGERWPCSAAQWAAQDGRWRALVGRWAEAKRALMAVLAVESNDNAPIVNLGVMAVADAEDALMAALDGAE